MMWLPNPPAYRGRLKTCGLRLAERLRHAGLHPFRPMTASEAAAFVERDPAVLPVAEDFLNVAGPTPPQPWVYHPLQDAHLLRLLHVAELKVRTLGARLSHD